MSEPADPLGDLIRAEIHAAFAAGYKAALDIPPSVTDASIASYFSAAYLACLRASIDRDFAAWQATVVEGAAAAP